MGDYVVTLSLEVTGDHLFDEIEGDLTAEQKQEIVGYITSIVSVFKPAGDYRLNGFDFEVGRVDR